MIRFVAIDADAAVAITRRAAAEHTRHHSTMSTAPSLLTAPEGWKYRGVADAVRVMPEYSERAAGCLPSGPGNAVAQLTVPKAVAMLKVN